MKGIPKSGQPITLKAKVPHSILLSNGIIPESRFIIRYNDFYKDTKLELQFKSGVYTPFKSPLTLISNGKQKECPIPVEWQADIRLSTIDELVLICEDGISIDIWSEPPGVAV